MVRRVLEKVEGVILRTQDYGETHKIVTIYTKDRGKLGVVARGAKKTKSRMAAVTQPFIYGEFFIRAGRNLGTLQQGEVLNSFRPIREDIIKTAYASYLAELTDKLIDTDVPDPFLFKQLYETLLRIAEGKDAEVLSIVYEWKVFQKSGIAPTVDRCVSCGRTEAPYFFSVAEGGLLCSDCRSLDPHAVPLSGKLGRMLQIFAEVDIERIGNISVKEENRRLLKELMEAYYDRYGGYFLKSRKFLKQLDLFK